MNATITIPKNGPFPEVRHDGLSDELAMSFARLAALTLPDEDYFVLMTLSNGTEKVIGLDTSTGQPTIIGGLG